MAVAHLPFRHGQRPQCTWPAAGVAQLYPHQFDGVDSVDKKRCFGVNPVMAAFKHAVSLAMAHAVLGLTGNGCLVVAGRQVQELACLHVLQCVVFMGGVFDCVVAPRRDLMLPAVDGPGVATASF